MDFRKVLRKTKYKDKIDYIMVFFENAGINDFESLQNAPVCIGHLPKIDIYDLVREINEALFDEESVVVMEKPLQQTKKIVTGKAEKAEPVLEKGDKKLPDVKEE